LVKPLGALKKRPTQKKTTPQKRKGAIPPFHSDFVGWDRVVVGLWGELEAKSRGRAK